MLNKIKFRIRLILESLLNLINPSKNSDTIVNFHKLYYDRGHQGLTWGASKYFGINVQKFPGDLLLYQEIIFETKPDLIIETGTAFGGTTLFLAHLCDAMGHGNIVSVDIERQGNPPEHPRIKYLLGSSVSPEIISEVGALVKDKERVMVILDSDHTMSHVLAELELYKNFVTPGCYLITEDTNVNGHPVYPEHGPGPSEALAQFLPSHSEFIVDALGEKHLMTFNPGGYLKKIK